VKTCLVIQGFGEKTDMATGRTLNLDASYEVIKEAVETAGVQCRRADEIVHSGTIDKAMYEAILRADLVVADLSTSNLNAAFELGVRYGLRPRATIVVAEDRFQNPFDVSHIVIRRYEHLGRDVGRREADRFRRDLSDAIRQILNGDQIDSPVYTFLGNLRPPAEEDTPKAAAAGSAPAMVHDQNAKQLLDLARAEMARGSFAAAAAVFEAVHAMRPNDPYVMQQRALATYKAELPDPGAALDKARDLLRTLDPNTTNDPETLGLWGAVHKRLWDLTSDPSHLDESIASYERGFYLKQDHYNGINLAYLLNVRSALAATAGRRADAITDFVLAQRVRRDVIRYCEPAVTAQLTTDERFWMLATLWQASVGLEDAAGTERWRAEAETAAPAPWMLATTHTQLDRLRALLASSPLAGL
jgi:tetratricopeptide (TPR) repeat protein